jgi:predicted Rossmann fold nucleotide-binding protein DprA/Smf involved in DNA uptake
MKVGVVGSRQRNTEKDRQEVIDFVNSLPLTDIVVSGGCYGPDRWAEDAAKARGMKTMIFRPERISRFSSYFELCNAYYERNRKIIDNSDLVYAFVARSGLKGGTRNTVNYALKTGKRVVLK